MDRRDGINTSVTIDVQMVFKGKTYSQLQAMNMNIDSKIRQGGSNLDIGYWESLLQQVRVFMARARYAFLCPTMWPLKDKSRLRGAGSLGLMSNGK